ncbi:MAG: SAM-dependent methyltransferase [Tannerella sp.]|nr:SAM-dependent methyltransferase [Tannerella sp.]
MNNRSLIYRRLFCRKGYGVHSPFVFDLITNVIEERHPYYYYQDLATARLQLLRNERPVNCRGRQTTIRKAVRRHCISKKEGELLFRLANRYKPRSVLTVGSSMGLIPLSLTGYASGIRCVTLEREAGLAAPAQSFFQKRADAPVQILTGPYHELFPGSLEMLKRLDCLFIGKEVDVETQHALFLQSLPYMHAHTFCLIGGIRSSSAHYRHWQQLCIHPKVTVTVDLHAFGLVFFQPQLHQRTYKSLIG